MLCGQAAGLRRQQHAQIWSGEADSEAGSKSDVAFVMWWMRAFCHHCIVCSTDSTSLEIQQDQRTRETGGKEVW